MDSSIKDRPHYCSHQDLAQFEALSTPLWIFDVDRHAMWWANSRALAFWRAENLEALIARDYSSDSETVRLRLRQVVESPIGGGRIQETWTLYPGESPTTVISDMQPVLIEEGRHGIMIEAVRTIDLQDDPEALRILEVARSSALLVSSFTMSGQLLVQNPASHACYALPPISTDRGDLDCRFADENISASILAAVEENGHFEAELAVRTVNGHRIHRILARKGRDPVTGEFVTVLNEEDMTEQVTLRLRLQRLNDELEARVAERTNNLQTLNESLAREIEERKTAEERLRHAQKMEAIGKLTGGIAHDFNNLLAVIMGNVEILQDQFGSDNKTLGSISRASERGAELTQRLLAFSRQQPLRPQTVNLGTLVSGMSELLARTLGETIEIRTVPMDDLWDAIADPGQVENAILNMALNARDAMPGGGTLSIECVNSRLDDAGEAQDPDVMAGDYVVLAVSDNGTGMSPRVRAKAFEPFFTTKEVGEGSGLGLSSVYGFAKQSGGHASIYSEPDRGTTVKLYLPRGERATVNPANEDSARDIPQGESETILIIEDDPDVRDLTERMLKALGYRTVAVGDAAAAEKSISEGQTYDLVLSDVVLSGGMSGPEFAAQIRARDPTARFVFMSGYPAEATQFNGLIEAGEVFLNKPFRKQALAEALREGLS